MFHHPRKGEDALCSVEFHIIQHSRFCVSKFCASGRATCFGRESGPPTVAPPRTAQFLFRGRPRNEQGLVSYDVAL